MSLRSYWVAASKALFTYTRGKPRLSARALASVTHRGRSSTAAVRLRSQSPPRSMCSISIVSIEAMAWETMSTIRLLLGWNSLSSRSSLPFSASCSGSSASTGISPIASAVWLATHLWYWGLSRNSGKTLAIRRALVPTSAKHDSIIPSAAFSFSSAVVFFRTASMFSIVIPSGKIYSWKFSGARAALSSAGSSPSSARSAPDSAVAEGAAAGRAAGTAAGSADGSVVCFTYSSSQLPSLKKLANAFLAFSS
mmetsp:Transcript_35609/g.76813  ORF Transcript_35609/g.76813 Transcript_35609/m.76813 type:complete len:252 (+) Transcript_35609:475-1230(+)